VHSVEEEEREKGERVNLIEKCGSFDPGRTMQIESSREYDSQYNEGYIDDN
jgi:hypothetical protein